MASIESRMTKLMDLVAIFDEPWHGPEPTFIPMDGRYICTTDDAPRIQQLIDEGKLPMPGPIPGCQHLSIRDMVTFQIMRQGEE